MMETTQNHQSVVSHEMPVLVAEQVRFGNVEFDEKADTESENGEVCQKLIEMSCAKIVNSKGERGGAKLHKNLLILHLLQKARDEHRRSWDEDEHLSSYCITSDSPENPDDSGSGASTSSSASSSLPGLLPQENPPELSSSAMVFEDLKPLQEENSAANDWPTGVAEQADFVSLSPSEQEEMICDFAAKLPENQAQSRNEDCNHHEQPDPFRTISPENGPRVIVEFVAENGEENDNDDVFLPSYSSSYSFLRQSLLARSSLQNAEPILPPGVEEGHSNPVATVSSVSQQVALQNDSDWSADDSANQAGPTTSSRRRKRKLLCALPDEQGDSSTTETAVSQEDELCYSLAAASKKCCRNNNLATPDSQISGLISVFNSGLAGICLSKEKDTDSTEADAEKPPSATCSSISSSSCSANDLPLPEPQLCFRVEFSDPQPKDQLLTELKTEKQQKQSSGTVPNASNHNTDSSSTTSTKFGSGGSAINVVSTPTRSLSCPLFRELKCES